MPVAMASPISGRTPSQAIIRRIEVAAPTASPIRIRRATAPGATGAAFAERLWIRASVSTGASEPGAKRLQTAVHRNLHRRLRHVVLLGRLAGGEALDP